MKKICALIFIIAISLMLTACGPNDDYYNLKTLTYYYYNDEAFMLDPYDYIKEYNDWLDITNSQIRNASKYFDAEIFYRIKDSGEDYQEFPYVNETGHIFTEKPLKDLKNNKQYEFKFYFYDENHSKDTRINYYGILTFKKSPANAIIKNLTNIDYGQTYNLLNNIRQVDENQNNVDLYELYDIKYFVNEFEVEYEDADVKGDYTFDTVGTYDILVQLIEKTDDSSTTDATTGASESTTEGKMVLNIRYTIEITE